MEFSKDRIEQRALFSDETEEYRSPMEADPGDTVTVYFRTAKNNIDKVYIILDDDEIEMAWDRSDELFDYYSYQIKVGEQPISYFYAAAKGQEICYYNRLGVTQDIQSCFAFRITPGFHIPAWARGAVMYQIFVDRFCNGDPANDVVDNEYVYIGRPVKRVAEWDKYPSAMDVYCFYGGDLKGVMDKLDYLKTVGVEVIYMNPIFVSPSNHKYDIQDYDYVDPHYGMILEEEGEPVKDYATDNRQAGLYASRTAGKKNLEASNALLIQLIGEIHKRGMRVILDGVFNHCGSFNKWLDREMLYDRSSGYEKGAYVSKDSPYRTFFKFNSEKWPCNGDYDGWWGHDTLPKLNYEESPKLYEYIMRIARKWVSPPFNVDGWRLDVAADLGHSSEFNHRFWRDFRQNVKEANPDALILAEHYGDPSSWLKGDEWDTVMNYDAFMEPVSWFLTGMEKHSDESNPELYGDGKTFARTMAYHMSRMQTISLEVAMNELSNHDHSRFLTRTNMTVGRTGSLGPEAAEKGVNMGLFRAAVVMQMTWPGAPTIYYGDEVGVCGWTDPDNRRTYPWGHGDLELLEFHRYIVGMRRWYKALRYGSLKMLLADRHIIAYGRTYYQSKCVIAVNSGPQDMDIELPVWELGITDDSEMVRTMLTDAERYNIGWVRYQVKDGHIKVHLEPYASILLKLQEEM